MLKTFLIILLVYQITGIGFLIYSLGQDYKGYGWSMHRFIKTVTSDRREWVMWFAISQSAVMAMVLFALVYVVAMLTPSRFIKSHIG